MLLFLLAACEPPPVDFYAYPEPGDWPALAGPGGPRVSYTEADLYQPCTYLTGGEGDVDHHNLVVMHDGYLLLPWAPEDGGGGITFFEFDDPCDPVRVGEAWSDTMRESHSMAFGRAGDREYLAVDYHVSGDEGGVGFFDVTDPAAPAFVSAISLPDYDYPDAYFRVVLSTFWQGDYLYASAGLNGVFVIDVSDPLSPELVAQYSRVGHLLGSFHAVGNLAMASSAGLALTVLYDISDPAVLDPIPGGEFEVEDRDGEYVPYYFANLGGEYGLFARKDEGGGPVIYDLSDPGAPRWVGDLPNDDGDGGYIFRQHDRLFEGESNFGSIYDISDPAAPSLVQRVALQGDLDTVTPVGNVAVLSVDEKAEPGQSSAVLPWDTAPDGLGPSVMLHSPAGGETWVATTGRIGLSFDEMIESGSVFEGSFRVWNALGEPVPGRFNTQESIVNFTPDEPLEADMSYIVEVPAGGITDVSGNPTEQGLRFCFSTGAALEVPE